MTRRGRFFWSALQLVVALAVLTAASTAAFGAPAAPAAAGDLEGSFGTGGKVTTDFAENGDQANGIAVQPDGKIVTAGTALVATQDFALARYDADGSLDPTFGTGGTVTLDFGGSTDQAFAVALQPDGMIVVAGGAGPDFGLARYRPDGTLDPTFGTGGKVTTRFGLFGGGTGAHGVAVQADGKIVLAGTTFGSTTQLDFGLARYNPNGSLDATFGTGGKVTTHFRPPIGSVDLGLAIALQPDGKIVAAGTSFGATGGTFALVRYTATGSLDGTFGSGGKVTTGFGGNQDEADAVAVQPDGKIVAAGKTGGQPFDFALARYNGDGTLDSTFGTAGKATTDFAGSPEDKAHAIVLQPDGTIVVAGETLHGGTAPSFDFALARYEGDGTLDPTFGTARTVTTDFGGHNDHAFAIALQPDGNIVAAGDAFPDFALARYVGGSAAAIADLAVELTDSPDPVPAGQTLTYDMSVTNHGPSDATGVTLIDTLAAGAGRIREIHIDLNSVVSSQGSCSTPSDGTLACLLGTIPATGSATVTISITPTEAGTITNVASASANEPDPNPADNSASETTTVNPAADLSVSLNDSPDPVLGGQALTYTATVANHGPAGRWPRSARRRSPGAQARPGTACHRGRECRSSRASCPATIADNSWAPPLDSWGGQVALFEAMEETV